MAYNALNSQQLDGKTFNEIQNAIQTQSIIGEYIGTGAGAMTIQCGFTPNFVFLCIYKNSQNQSSFCFIKENVVFNYYNFVWKDGFKIVNNGFYVYGTTETQYQNEVNYGYNWKGFTHFYLALKFT